MSVDSKPYGSLPDVYGLFQGLLSPHSARQESNGLVFTHRQADPDALCSAGALKLLFKNTSSRDIGIVVPQGASVLGKQVASQLGIDFVEEPDKELLREASFMIVVDTGDPKLLEPYAESFRESKAKKFLIDHHASSLQERTWGFFDKRLVVTSSTSTCEIVALGVPSEIISEKMADILLTGLMFDSQHLGIATKTTLEAALILVEAGAEISKSKRILRHEPERSEIVGRLKAAQRLRYEEAKGRIIASTEISSYHAAVARMLVEIGADVGIAYGETGGEARLSARCSQSFFKETGIDLSFEIKKIADYFEVVGGGHSTAASISGKIDASVLADRLKQNLKSILLQK